MAFKDTVEIVGKTVDALGVAVTVIGVAAAIVMFLAHLLRPSVPAIDEYRRLRRSVGRSILLGLELLVAGDIIRTVAVSPSLTNVAVLAVIVAIRTFLSFTLEVEITSRWPWQPDPRQPGTRAE